LTAFFYGYVLDKELFIPIFLTMKNLIIIFLLFIFAFPGIAKPGKEKSFLILFHKNDLKNLKTSAHYIELSLMPLFETKAYAGNSDAAILVKIPDDKMDTKQLGSFFVRINSTTVLPIEDFAYKIVDMEQNRETFKNMLAFFESKNSKNKRNGKSTKSTPSL
jgi:hypothetical protein